MKKRLLSTLLVLCMVLTLLPFAALAETTVTAGTPEELLAALKPGTPDAPVVANVTVLLEGKDYVVDESFDLSYIENVTIRGTEGTRLLCTSPDDLVITFFYCKNITLENLTIGHELSPWDPNCWLGVVYGFGTDNVTIKNCDMFGCGYYGIGGQFSSFTVEKSTIRDCSWGITSLLASSADFTDCVFSGNGYNDPNKYAVDLRDADYACTLSFKNCTFSGNKNPRFSDYYAVVENCKFENNAWESLAELPLTDGRLYFDTQTKMVVDCVGNVTRAVIPGAINGVAVTAIDERAFLSSWNLTSLTIPAGVTSIGEWAFGSAGLKDVYYGGSEEQWKQIKIDPTNDAALANAEIHYNSPVPVLSAQKLKVNGDDKTCEMYNIKDENYFKLRDLAYMLRGTSSQFSVDYDYASQMISIATGKPYTPAGTEMGEIVDNSGTFTPSPQEIYINGEKATLTAYNIGGSNFFRLRDLGSALDFVVEFDFNTNTAVVKSK